MRQMPIVINALNEGFVQTLKLFSITLLGAFPLGLLIAFGSISKIRLVSFVTRFTSPTLRNGHAEASASR